MRALILSAVLLPLCLSHSIAQADNTFRTSLVWCAYARALVAAGQADHAAPAWHKGIAGLREIEAQNAVEEELQSMRNECEKAGVPMPA